MADLIDREKTKAAFEPWLNVKGYSEGELNIIRAVLYEITIMPSVDAVNVVRCKDCVKCKADTIFNQYWCGGEMVLPDGFCNYGRRKDG